MPSNHAPTLPTPTLARQAKVIASVSFGVFLEWYDYMAFAAVAVIIGQQFFPADNPALGLLASLATFGAGMLVRPLGSLFFGNLMDRYGALVHGYPDML